MSTNITITLPQTLKELREIYRRQFNVPHLAITKQMIADWLATLVQDKIGEA